MRLPFASRRERWLDSFWLIIGTGMCNQIAAWEALRVRRGWRPRA